MQRGLRSLPGLRTQLGRRPRCSQGRGTGQGPTGPRAQALWWRLPLVPPTSWPPPGSPAVASCTGSAGAPDCPARPGTCLRGFQGPRPRQTLLPSGPQRAGIRPSTVPSPSSTPRAVSSRSSPGMYREGCLGLPNEFLLMAVLLQKCPAALPPGPLPPPFAEEKTPTRAPNGNLADHHLGPFGATPGPPRRPCPWPTVRGPVLQ